MAETTRREAYDQTGNAAFEAQIAQRTAVRDAEFLLPHIQPGMSLLDVGCGPGSITIGLAGVLAPGEVVGLDLQEALVERGRSAAVAASVGNVRFEVGDCYKLPFPDASFDACFANSVLQHLREPVTALTEMRRVLRPGGVVGIRDLVGGGVLTPESPLVEEALALNARVRAFNGGDTRAGAHHREYLVAAGFARTAASATAATAGTLEETRAQVTYLRSVFPGSMRTALAQGWIDQKHLDAIYAALDVWAERPDAFMVMLRCNALGWID